LVFLKNIQQRDETLFYSFGSVNTFRSLFVLKSEVFSYFLNKSFKNRGVGIKNIFNYFENIAWLG